MALKPSRYQDSTDALGNLCQGLTTPPEKYFLTPKHKLQPSHHLQLMLSLGIVGTGSVQGQALLGLIVALELDGAYICSPKQASSPWDQPASGMLWTEPSVQSPCVLAQVTELVWISGQDFTHAVGQSRAVVLSLTDFQICWDCVQLSPGDVPHHHPKELAHGQWCTHVCRGVRLSSSTGTPFVPQGVQVSHPGVLYYAIPLQSFPTQCPSPCSHSSVYFRPVSSYPTVSSRSH